MIIYKITNKTNSKIYIGQTKESLVRRFNRHCTKHSKCKALASAINKYGRDNFVVEQLIICDSREALNYWEQYYIELYNSYAPVGYNLVSGGEVRLYTSEVTRKKLSEINKGRKFTELHKQNLSKASTNRKMSDETKEKIRQYNLTHSKKQFSEQAKQNIRNHIYTRLAHSIIDSNGTVYRSIREASEKLNINQECISGVLKGKYKQAKGYTFKYAS